MYPVTPPTSAVSTRSAIVYIPSSPCCPLAPISPHRFATCIPVPPTPCAPSSTAISKSAFSAREFKKRYKVDAPVVLGEFASKGSRYTVPQWVNMAIDGGYDGAVAFLEQVVETVRAIVFLTGCRTPSELRTAPKVIGSTLRAWLEQAR